MSWSRYRLTVMGQEGDLALVEAEGMTDLILLISTAAERDANYNGVFLPAVAALTPNG